LCILVVLVSEEGKSVENEVFVEGCGFGRFGEVPDKAKH